MKKKKQKANVLMNSTYSELSTEKEYAKTLDSLKQQIQEAQLKATLSVNQELIHLYWKIGSSIIEKQTKSGWEAKVVNRLANDLRFSFFQMKRFSFSNVKYMANFAKEFPGFLIGQQVVGQIPWGIS